MDRKDVMLNTMKTTEAKQFLFKEDTYKNQSEATNDVSQLQLPHQDNTLIEQLAYWKRQLEAAPAVLDLPIDSPRPLLLSNRVASYSFTISQELTDTLKHMSHQENCTLHSILLATFTILLYRYTGQQDLLVGTHIGREGVEQQKQMDMFTSTLPIHTSLSGDMSFRAVLKSIHDTILDAQKYQDIPFKHLVKLLQPDGEQGHNPFFQTLLILDTAHTALPYKEVFTFNNIETHISRPDIALRLAVRPEGLIGQIEYGPELFDTATIARMAGHWQTLLQGIAAHPEQHLSEFPLLTQEERQQLLVEWNTDELPAPSVQLVHQRFEAQVEQTPDAIAIRFEDTHLTYRELNTRANQLAHALQHRGVGPDVLVGICMERSVEMVVALLAVLKAGGAFVPLDASYPQEHLAFLLHDSQITVLLTQQQVLERLPAHSIPTLCLDTDESLMAHEDSDMLHNPHSAVTAEHLAYVIYTSGSTGTPKGVLIPHGAIALHTQTIMRCFQLGPGDHVLQFSTFSFDAALEQILSTLMVGAQLILRGPEVWSAAELYEKIISLGLTVVNFPTAYWQQVTQEWTHASYVKAASQLRLVIVGGDRVLPEYVTLWQHLPMAHVRLLNAYGPTETTITATTFEISRPSDHETLFPFGRIPIGRPLPHRTSYILDRQGKPVPIGVAGELYLGGPLLARGYLNRPDLTAEKFLTDPFHSDPEARLYRTGDLARYLPDGTIDFLGRLDHQVKIRGFRIELGEIETVLSQHPTLREAVVVAREDVPGIKRLVAYLVADEGQPVIIEEIRHFLQQKLPAYMLPSAFVQLEALPLTPTGKVDRRRLPAPDNTQVAVEGNVVAPRTPIEELLATIWSHVLRLDRVGIHDNFFELGGDSILSIQIIARAHQAGLSLTPKHLFQYQTIAQLAEAVTSLQPVEAQQGPVTGTLALTPIQHWFFERQFLNPDHWNQAWLLEVNQALDVVLMEQALQHVLTHHDALRLRFKSGEKGWQQVHAEEERSEVFRQIDMSNVADAEQHVALEAAVADAQTSLNIEMGPLMRCTYFDMGADRPARLLIVIHHLVVDGVSWRILLEDLTTAYEQLREGIAIHLPAKTTSFHQWVQQLTEYAKSAVLHQELPYWLNTSRTSTSALPVDYTNELEANTMASARTVEISLSIQETQALLHSVPKAYHTQINDVLLTALVQAFARWTGESTLLVDLEGHGREPIYENVNLSRTVGWFTSVFPVCLSLHDHSPVETLKAVKEQLRLIPNHGIGYGVLRYMSQQQDIERLKALPQAQVSFNYLGQFDSMVSESALFKFANESAGSTCDPKEKRSYLLEIEGLVINDRLQISLLYNERIHQQNSIEYVAECYLEALRTLIAHCQSSEIEGHTTSDDSLASLIDDLTLEHLPNTAQAEEDSISRTPIVAVQASGNKRPFFYLHGTWNSNPFYCIHLARYLGPDQPFYTLESYNFDGLQTPPSVEAMASAHIQSLRTIQPEGPYLLGGFCNGALVAYEMARQLEREGQKVDFLVLIEPAYPIVLYNLVHDVIKGIGHLMRLGEDKQLDMFLRLRHVYKYLRHERKLENLVVEDFRVIDPGIETLHPPIHTLRQENIAIFNWIAAGYKYPSYAGKVLLLWASEEPFARLWRRNSAKNKTIELHFVPGTHLGCITQHIQTLAETLKQGLRKFQTAQKTQSDEVERKQVR